MGCGPSSPSVASNDQAGTADTSGTNDSPTEMQTKSGRSAYRASIVSLQIPKDYTDDMSSDGMSDRSMEGETQENSEYLCGTDVALQWLLQRISDKLGREIEEEPQWITERLNRPSWDEDYASSSVIRVTFGWEDEELPKSVCLKLPVSKEKREDDEGKFHYIMFKRECNVYEWTQKYPKIAAPKIFHIKRHSKETGGSGCVVMEDMGERGQQQDAFKGCSVELVRDLLKHLAQLHALSMKQTSWNTMIADLAPSYYTYIIGNYDKTMDFFERHDVDHSRFVHISKFFTMEYLHSTATESAEELQVPRALVQGEPYANNVFSYLEGSEEKVSGIIDWTECHSGCFAEDIAKAICWNLSLKDRIECTSSLLDSYHHYFTEFHTGEHPLTVDLIRKAYERFLPFAMVTLVGKVMQVRNRDDVENLVERAKGLIQNVYTTARLMQDG